MPFSPRDIDSKEKPYLAGLLLILVTVATVNTIWSHRDHGLMPYTDSYAYLSRTLHLADELGQVSPSQLGAAVGRASLVGRPPLYQVATLPAVYLLGRSEDAARSINVVFLALLLVSVYGIGRLCHGPAAGLLGALLVACYPPAVHLSRMYLPHYASLSIAALCLWLMVSLLYRRSIRVAWALGIALAAGMLTHPYFAWVSIAPAVTGGIVLVLSAPGRRPGVDAGGAKSWLGDRLRDRFLLFGLLPAGVFALGAAAWWYLNHAGPSFVQMRRMMERGQGHVGFGDAPASFAWYAATAPGALSNVLAAVAAAGLIAAILRRQRADWLLLAGFGGAYFFLSRVPVLAWIYFAAALPIVAVLSAQWIARLRDRRLRRAITGVAAAAAVFSFAFVTWGESSWSRTLAAALGSPAASGTCATRDTTALCPTPPDPRPWPWEELRDVALDGPPCQTQPCKMMLVDLERTAAHAFDFYLTRERLQDRVTVARATQGEPYNFWALFGDYVLYMPARQTQGAGIYRTATLRLLRSPPAEFAAAHEVYGEIGIPGPEGAAATILRRTHKLTVKEAEAVIDALEIPERFKSHGFLALGKQYFKMKAYRQSVTYYRQAVKLLPRNLGARVGLAEALARRGATDAALAQLEIADRQYPKSKRVRRAMRAIEKAAEEAGR